MADSKHGDSKQTALVAQGTGTTAGRPAKAAATRIPSVPWVEKYRPTDVAAVVGHAETRERLQLLAKHGDVPHMILAGPPGTGKTTSVWCMARALHQGNASVAILELNASDSRGIDVVRSKITQFAKKQCTLPTNHQKLVILDEADAMTPAAQQALKSLMDKYAATTRFALACNNAKEIIEPIQSRCITLPFSRLSDTEMRERLHAVATQEGVADSITPDGWTALLFVARGDLRQGLNTLQAAASGLASSAPSKAKIDANRIYAIADQPPPATVQGIVACCQRSQIREACALLHELWKKGHAAVDIVTTFSSVCKHPEWSSWPTDTMQQAFIREIGLCHARVGSGLGTIVQLNGLVAALAALGVAPTATAAAAKK